jgi:phosphate transport system substrate-binding protein
VFGFVAQAGELMAAVPLIIARSLPAIGLAGMRTSASLAAGVAALLIASSFACAAPGGSARSVIRITGSDTMINLLQAWAEHYTKVRPAVSVQVAGGGSGVGIAGLIDGTLDIAAASREMRSAERERARARHAVEPVELTVARDALAVYVHKDNPLRAISIDELAEIYGEQGRITHWAGLGGGNPACRSDQIIRVGRQNNSGTFAYFRDVVLGRAREYSMGSIDQSGSKDVVALVSSTPCAIGYSGIAFATPGVRTLELSARRGGPATPPNEATVVAASYPLARPLYLYTVQEPKGELRAFLDWVLTRDGQQVVRELGLVPAPGADSPPRAGDGR